VSERLTIEAEWERLERGSPEERAAFAAIGIRCDDVWLTEAEDTFVKRIRQKVHLSGYHLAEWFAWNWWRLRWEPRRRSHDWAMAHRMSTIGAGYVWPNITIVSDGERIALDAEPTASTPFEPLRYISRFAAVVRASEFEGAVDAFVAQVISQLREERVSGSNLEEIWTDVLEERATAEIARRRKLEALLGRDAGEVDDALIERLLQDATELGERAVEELAADRTGEHQPVTSLEIKELARQQGFESDPRNVVRLRDKSRDSLPMNVPAWRRGVAAAVALRQQEQLGAARISNDRLCQMTGVPKATVQRGEKAASFSFALDDGPAKGHVVLRSGYETGRRFNLARLLGDRVAVTAGGKMLPATRTYTYRQKLQRAFAGEFLCPFEALADMLHGDFSVDAIDAAAAHFNVSDRTVRTLLANHGLIDREEIVGDFDFSA
jgi:hypothetical protein